MRVINVRNLSRFSAERTSLGPGERRSRSGNDLSRIMILQAVTPVDEEIKMAVFEKNICPDDVRDHLCLNAARLTTYDKMKEEVAGVLLARQ